MVFVFSPHHGFSPLFSAGTQGTQGTLLLRCIGGGHAFFFLFRPQRGRITHSYLEGISQNRHRRSIAVPIFPSLTLQKKHPEI